MSDGSAYPDGVSPRQAAAKIFKDCRVRDWGEAVSKLPETIQESTRDHLRSWHRQRSLKARSKQP